MLVFGNLASFMPKFCYFRKRLQIKLTKSSYDFSENKPFYRKNFVIGFQYPFYFTNKEPNIMKACPFFVPLFLFYGFVLSAQTDVEGSKDHPMVSRYPNSYISYFEF